MFAIITNIRKSNRKKLSNSTVQIEIFANKVQFVYKTANR